MDKKFLIIIALILVIVIGIFTAKAIFKGESEVTDVSGDNIENKNVFEENSVINEIEEEEKNPEEEEETVVEKEEEPKKEETSETDEEKAKRIVKENWGEDDSIYYSYDGIDDDGNYIICVREKSTTKALCWYYVDVENGTFEIK